MLLTSVLRDKIYDVLLARSLQSFQKLSALVFRLQQIQKRFIPSVWRSPLTTDIVILSASQHLQAEKLLQ